MKQSEWEAQQNRLAEGDSEHTGTQAPTDTVSQPEEKKAAVINLSDKGIDAARTMTIDNPFGVKPEEQNGASDKTMSTLRALLQYLKSISSNPKAFERLEEFLDKQDALAKQAQSSGNSLDPMQALAGIAAQSRGRSGSEPTVIVDRRETFEAESEYTSFSATGLAKTEDGRELHFNVDFEMSRSFMNYTRIDNKYEAPQLRNVVCDPLVINVGADVASVSDQKFRFDLDGDGSEDSISMLGKGSGFLALDKNGDGKINDGHELFGTQSGNGFADLAAYDEDHNGWIDENDSVFDKLRVWFKDEEGTDRLIDLKSADVGAIYLGNASTEFSMKNADTHELNGVLRTSGIFLRESGGAGTVQHVDLAL